MSTLIANLRNKPDSVHFEARITYFRNGDRAVTNLWAGKGVRETVQAVLNEALSEYGHQYDKADVAVSLVCSECNGAGRLPAKRRAGCAVTKACPVCKGIGSDSTV